MTNNNNVSLSIIKESKNAYSWQNDKMTMTFFESMNQEDMYHWFATNDKPTYLSLYFAMARKGAWNDPFDEVSLILVQVMSKVSVGRFWRQAMP